MVRHALCTVSAAAALALTAAVPAVACTQPTGTTSPQTQSQQVPRGVAKGFYRHHHPHFGRFRHEVQPATTSTQGSTDNQQQSQQSSCSCSQSGSDQQSSWGSDHHSSWDH